jgi:glutamyl-tRNA reductase
MMSVGESVNGSADEGRRVRRERDRTVEEAVERAVRRMDADEYEREVLREMAERIAELVTRPVVEAAEAENGEGGSAAELFLG